MPALGLGIEFLTRMAVKLAGAGRCRLASARGGLARVFPGHGAGAFTLPMGADAGLALALLLSGSSRSFLLFGALQVAPVAGAALVFRGAGLLQRNSYGLLPILHFAASAAPELAMFELMHDT